MDVNGWMVNFFFFNKIKQYEGSSENFIGLTEKPE